MKGYVYYDDEDELIRAVSFTKDDSLGHNHIVVSYDDAVMLMDGGLDKWKVGSRIPNVKTLIPIDQPSIISLKEVDDSFVVLPNEPLGKSNELRVCLAKKSLTISFTLTVRGNVYPENPDATMDIILVKAGDPSVVLDIIACPVGRLFSERKIVFPINPQAAAETVEARTKRLIRNTFFISAEYDNEAIPPPLGKIPSLIRIKQIENLPDTPCLLIVERNEELFFSCHMGGGTRYDMGKGEIPIVFSKKNTSADEMLYFDFLPLDILDFRLSVPKKLSDYDIHMSPIFEQIFFMKVE